MLMLMLMFVVMQGRTDQGWPALGYQPLSGINRSCLHWRLHLASTANTNVRKKWTRDSDERGTHDSNTNTNSNKTQIWIKTQTKMKTQMLTKNTDTNKNLNTKTKSEHVRGEHMIKMKILFLVILTNWHKLRIIFGNSSQAQFRSPQGLIFS